MKHKRLKYSLLPIEILVPVLPQILQTLILVERPGMFH